MTSKTKEIGRTIMKVEDMDEDTISGIGYFRPQWLQQWATPKVFMVFYTLTGVFQGSVYLYLIGVLSTLEKRYAFNSKISGAVLTMDEITPCVLGTLVGYIGGRSHRPRLLAFGMMLAVCCCFLSALPYFLYGRSDKFVASSVRNDTGAVYCGGTSEKNCEAEDRPPTLVAVACLFFANFLKGFSNVSYFVVGISFIDDTAKKTNTPLYFAISLSMRMFGSHIGLSMSSTFLSYYEDPTFDPGFGPGDPRWIGAWWIGFVLQGVILLLLTLPLFLFPRRLPSQRKTRSPDFEKENFKQSVLGLFSALARLAKNPLYVCFTVGVILNPIFYYGMMNPRYLENQFYLSSSTANLLSGPPVSIPMQIATFLTGAIIWKVKPTARQLTGVATTTQLVLVASYLILMLPSCKNKFDDGTHFTNGLTLENECNANFNCTTNVMSPVCGPDGKTTYFSPCYAGCTVSTQTFQNCSCLRDGNGSFSFSSSVDNGYCLDDKCSSMLAVFLAGLITVYIMSSVFIVGQELLLLRSIGPEDKTIAIGTFEALCSALGYTPFPVMYGALIDSSCLVWESRRGEMGNCWVYDLDRYRKLTHGVSAAVALCSAFFFGCVWKLSKRFQPMYEDRDVLDDKEAEATEDKMTTSHF